MIFAEQRSLLGWLSEHCVRALPLLPRYHRLVALPPIPASHSHNGTVRPRGMSRHAMAAAGGKTVACATIVAAGSSAACKSAAADRTIPHPRTRAGGRLDSQG